MKWLIFPIIMAMCSPAYAAQCAPTEQVEEVLSSRYGETLQADGSAEQNRTMQVWANRETGTWSIVISAPEGISCLMSSGGNYKAVLQPPNV